MHKPEFHNLSAEEQRSTMLLVRPDLMSPGIKTHAELEHECRTLNNAEHACAGLQQGVHNACANCVMQHAQKKAA